MKCTLVGIKDINFKTDKGETIDGVKLHYLNVAENVIGVAANAKFISRNVFKSFGVTIEELSEFINAEINIGYNDFGKICELTV